MAFICQLKATIMLKSKRHHGLPIRGEESGASYPASVVVRLSFCVRLSWPNIIKADDIVAGTSGRGVE